MILVSVAVPAIADKPPAPDLTWNPPSETPAVKSGEPSSHPPESEKPTCPPGMHCEVKSVMGNIAFWVQYGPNWAMTSAVYLGNTVRTAINNDQYQYLYWVEVYPDGTWRYWGLGYHNSGWVMKYRFLGDVAGWHKVFIYGSKSGYSNPIWVYVWANNNPSPQPTPTPQPNPGYLSFNAWMTKTTYSPGESIDVGYYVNMPATVKITTYTPYGTQVFTNYVNAGTHYQHLGTAGSITGWRTVKVEAWANNQYRVVHLSYNVQYILQDQEPNPPPMPNPSSPPPVPPW